MNSYQQKQRKQSLAQAATVLELYNAGIEQMKQEVISQRESLMEAFITNELGTMILPTPEEIARRGSIIQHTDGYDEFTWDGVPRLVFHPVNLKVVDGKQRIVQEFHTVPLPAEESAEEEQILAEVATDGE